MPISIIRSASERDILFSAKDIDINGKRIKTPCPLLYPSINLNEIPLSASNYIYEIWKTFDISISSGNQSKSSSGGGFWQFVSVPLDVNADVSTVFDDSLWGDGYFAESVGVSDEQMIRRYIREHYDTQ